MSKKKKSNHPVKPLSPENYIRQKARTLPIHVCWVNCHWEESKMANIIVSRKHTNGNVSLALFLVDLFCQGVKDTGFKFNISQIEYEEFLESINFPDDAFEEIDYNLAHNIIFAGYEFAMEYDIKPHKLFSSTTMLFLEEDNDDVELIDIECGYEGKPCIIAGPDNFDEMQDLYNRLAGQFGEDSIIFEDAVDDIDDEDFDIENEDFDDFIENEDLFEYQYQKEEEERTEDILKLKDLLTKEKLKGKDETQDAIIVTNRLFYNHFNLDEIIDTRNRISKLVWADIENSYIYDLLELNADTISEAANVANEFLSDSNNVKDSAKILNLIEQYPAYAFFKYMHILNLELLNPDLPNEEEIFELLEKYQKAHPDYFALKFKKDIYNMRVHHKSEFIEPLVLSNESLDDFFPDKELYHFFEYYNFIMALFEYYILQKDFLSIDSIANYLLTEQIDYVEEFNEIHFMNLMLKTEFCNMHYIS